MQAVTHDFVSALAVLSQRVMVVLGQLLIKACWKVGQLLLWSMQFNRWSKFGPSCTQQSHPFICLAGTPESKSLLGMPDLEEVDMFEDACALGVHAVLRHVLIRAP